PGALPGRAPQADAAPRTHGEVDAGHGWPAQSALQSHAHLFRGAAPVRPHAGDTRGFGHGRGLCCGWAAVGMAHGYTVSGMRQQATQVARAGGLGFLLALAALLSFTPAPTWPLAAPPARSAEKSWWMRRAGRAETRPATGRCTARSWKVRGIPLSHSAPTGWREPWRPRAIPRSRCTETSASTARSTN